MTKNFFPRLRLVALLLCISLPTYARWATSDEAPIEALLDNLDLKINGDGTSEFVREERVKILPEQGRGYASGYYLYYNQDSEKLKIIEAKTIYKGKEYTLTADMIEDKPLASSPQGFDQQRQLLLSFPKAEIGAEIYLKYIFKTIKPVLDNFYSENFSWGWPRTKTLKLKIRSELPLYIKVNDPNNVLAIKKDGDQAFNYLTMTLTKPIYTQVIDEPSNAVLNKRHLTWISISSVTTRKELAKRFAARYEQVASQALPPVLEQILAATKHIKKPEDQLNAVTSLLNEKFHYMGDWRTVAGKLFPRDLLTIAASHVGDCKDFSTMTVSLLQKLGYKAQVAFVLRGEGKHSREGGMPNIYDFNHAFVKATSKNGKVYWIDPTNVLSMAGGIFPDIAGKMALVLDSKRPSYERVSSIDPSHSAVIVKKNLTINGLEVINSGDLNFKGEAALRLSGFGLYASKQRIADYIFHMLSQTHLDEADKLKLVMPDLNSRVVRDLNILFKYKDNHQTFRTNIAPAIDLNFWSIKDLTGVSPAQVSDLFIGPQRTIIEQTVIEGLKVKNVKALNYHKKTPWLEVIRSCKWNGNNTEISDKLVIKRMFIFREELASQMYKNLREELLQNLKNTAIVLSEEL